MDLIRRRPDSRLGPPENFTGTVWIDALVVDNPLSRLRINSVHFAPGARTAWHAHRNGQVLHVIDGVGRAQERGGPLHEIRSGDTIVSAPGEWHWHGAAPRHFMSHLGMSEPGSGTGDTTWGDHVAELAYLAEVEATGE